MLPSSVTLTLPVVASLPRTTDPAAKTAAAAESVLTAKLNVAVLCATVDAIPRLLLPAVELDDLDLIDETDTQTLA